MFKNKSLDNVLFAILSIFLAIIIWFITMNYANPLIDKTINLPIKIVLSEQTKNDRKEYTLSSQNKTVQLNYKIRTNDEKNVSAKDIEAVVNISKTINSGNMVVDILYSNDVDDYMYNINYFPQQVYVNATDIITNIYQIEYETVGDMPANTSINKVILDPTEIFIDGTKNNIDKINKVVVKIPITNESDNFIGLSDIVIYDENNKVLNSDLFDISNNSIKYDVSLNFSKTININYNLIGELQNGYKIDEVKIEPTNMIVYATQDVLNSINSLELPPIDISNLTADYSNSLRINSLLPNNVSKTNIDYVKIDIKISNDNIIHNNIIKHNNIDTSEQNRINENDSTIEFDNDINETVTEEVGNDIIDTTTEFDNDYNTNDSN